MTMGRGNLLGKGSHEGDQSPRDGTYGMIGVFGFCGELHITFAQLCLTLSTAGLTSV